MLRGGGLSPGQIRYGASFLVQTLFKLTIWISRKARWAFPREYGYNDFYEEKVFLHFLAAQTDSPSRLFWRSRDCFVRHVCRINI